MAQKILFKPEANSKEDYDRHIQIAKQECATVIVCSVLRDVVNNIVVGSWTGIPSWDELWYALDACNDKLSWNHELHLTEADPH